ncbi:MAG: GNAT family N-acetyltransferase [Cyclobacteriaceae bacterium]
MKLPERIETERLILSRLRYEDAEEIFYCYASKPEATRYVSWPTHKTIADTRSYLRHAIAGWQQGIDFSFGIRTKEHHRFIGSFGIIHQSGKIQFGYVLGPPYWGKGYATEVCLRMMDELKKQPNLFRIGTFVDVANVASSRVLVKAGLVEEARLEKWFRFVNQQNQARDCILYILPFEFLQ